VPAPPPKGDPPPGDENDAWVEPDAGEERLAEGEMEILLTGHAATHGIEGEDNWLLDADDAEWRKT